MRQYPTESLKNLLLLDKLEGNGGEKEIQKTKRNRESIRQRRQEENDDEGEDEGDNMRRCL